MNEKQIKQWEKTRKMGKRKYVIKWVLYWGIMTAITWSLLMHFWVPEEPWYIRPVIALILFPITGLFVGLFNWNYIEKKYRKV